MLTKYRNSKRKRITVHTKMSYTKNAPLKRSPFTGLNSEKAIAENPKIHASIREKQLKIAELMIYRKNDNVVKKNVNFLPPDKKEETEKKDDIEETKKFSISNASIAEILNKKLFGNRSSWNNKTGSSIYKTKSGEKLSILSNYRNSFANKEDSNITNKVSESHKENLKEFLRMKSCAYSSKSIFFAQKKLSGISKKSYSADRIVSLNSQNSGEEVDAGRGGISLMQRVRSGPTNTGTAGGSDDDLDGGSYCNLNEGMSNGENRDSDDNRAHDHEDSTPSSHPAYNQGNQSKRDELKKSKNESHKNTRSYRFFRSRKSAKPSPSDENNAKDKKRKINSFFDFLNLKKRYNKRKNDLQAENDKKKKNASKEQEEINCPSSDREKSSSSSHPNKKNIKSFFCVK
ncbi:conserved Plasmodium protein, unknown function [Plasmodium knowlesi strain H]|uniref:Uncharacterized protein n=3 Tax=Plasmodium knowlesi TaxID=5850 RepID=A0A5K1U9Z4_PLAKH|nr:conserved Plasmodium protein, unknown function [Plasmodium knowlesi strain H]OTN68115.1 Uncharacterized protein PKNOH_S04358400 [Plasmodium knowlesi]CAA9986947.1 conserved Plasmodium protein, unknown function [Plasmodium knowlesi strain H]SBO26469.1 conserved Plasmodium protein, unknown function [Plasmodium knowlesi strain H]SBO28151.1 conserved Plasmodium protein, unknown function [Plasmodium knowlesi strain H]VVS76421.1 conserved Plasmodium protein, unknown function [Plasmodium knowlesi s|eukprot:XP_002258194.1 hypothetical protein, conserved in Plasmodium species [Plasmodium knowlesi strain H]